MWKFRFDRKYGFLAPFGLKIWEQAFLDLEISNPGSVRPNSVPKISFFEFFRILILLLLIFLLIIILFFYYHRSWRNSWWAQAAQVQAPLPSAAASAMERDFPWSGNPLFGNSILMLMMMVIMITMMIVTILIIMMKIWITILLQMITNQWNRWVSIMYELKEIL